MASWRQVWEFSQPLTKGAGGGGAPDETVTYNVAQGLPVIVWDRETKQRRIIPMRWGFPHPKDWRRPQPIHARSETIDTVKAFREAFVDGQRGIVVFETFNEGEEVGSKTVQWTIDPKDGHPRGFAFLWRRFEIPGIPQPLLACVMATVPASEAIRRTIMPNDPDPRMPAILEDEDWETWLDQNDSTPDAAKNVLKTMEGVTWKMERQEKPPKPKKAKPEKTKQEDDQPDLL